MALPDDDAALTVNVPSLSLSLFSLPLPSLSLSHKFNSSPLPMPITTRSPRSLARSHSHRGFGVQRRREWMCRPSARHWCWLVVAVLWCARCARQWGDPLTQFDENMTQPRRSLLAPSHYVTPSHSPSLFYLILYFFHSFRFFFSFSSSLSLSRSVGFVLSLHLATTGIVDTNSLIFLVCLTHSFVDGFPRIYICVCMYIYIAVWFSCVV